MNRSAQFLAWQFLAALCFALTGCGGGDDGGGGGATPGISQQHAYVKASNTGADDQFGSSLAVSADGSTLVVGADFEDSNAVGIDGDQTNNGASAAGAVYVYTRGGATWTQHAYIKASNTGELDRFGSSVAISGDGNTLAVGAISEASDATGIDADQANNDAPEAGAVYVFARTGATWAQQAYVKASNMGAGDGFGFSVAVSADGNTLVVGAIGEDSADTGVGGDQDSNVASNAGAVYVYTRNGATWMQQAYVKASNTGVNDLFGFSVAVSGDGNTLAVGAINEASDATGIDGDEANVNATQAGAVYVFTRSGATWTQQAYVKASNTEANDRFAEAVALSADGNTLAVGASLEDGNAMGINGDQDSNAASNSGAVYVYTRSGTTWTQQAYVKASNTALGIEEIRFGASVAVSGDGNMLAAGASLEHSNAVGIDGDQTSLAFSSGAVYVYTRSGATWTQQAYVKASNTGAEDQFGDAVALSGDGGTLAVAAISEDSDATGINGEQTSNAAPRAGAVYVFQ